jgi:hypothetical protein
MSSGVRVQVSEFRCQSSGVRVQVSGLAACFVSGHRFSDAEELTLPIAPLGAVMKDQTLADVGIALPRDKDYTLLRMIGDPANSEVAIAI